MSSKKNEEDFDLGERETTAASYLDNQLMMLMNK